MTQILFVKIIASLSMELIYGREFDILAHTYIYGWLFVRQGQDQTDRRPEGRTEAERQGERGKECRKCAVTSLYINLFK